MEAMTKLIIRIYGSPPLFLEALKFHRGLTSESHNLFSFQNHPAYDSHHTPHDSSQEARSMLPTDATSARLSDVKSQFKKRDNKSEQRSTMRSQAQSPHIQEPRNHK